MLNNEFRINFGQYVPFFERFVKEVGSIRDDEDIWITNNILRPTQILSQKVNYLILITDKRTRRNRWKKGTINEMITSHGEKSEKCNNKNVFNCVAF